MKEVFENIIEKMEDKRKTAELLIMENPHDELDRIQTQTAEDFASAYKDAIEIVNRAAAEYNNGWIQVSERLPKEPEEGLTDIDECDEYIVMIEGADIPTALNYVGDGEWYRDGNYYKVIAWMPLPQQYQPNVCQDTNCPYNDGNDCPAAEGCAGYERKRTNFDMCCESMEAMAQIIDIAKIGWTKDKIMEWLQSEVEE